MTSTTQRIGRKGEQLVFDILNKAGNAQWANGEAEARAPFDLLWEGIEIDVKTTTFFAGIARPRCIFLDRPMYLYRVSEVTEADIAEKYVGVIKVFVYLPEQGDSKFWVSKGNSKKYNYKFYLKDALNAKQLPDAIKKLL